MSYQKDVLKEGDIKGCCLKSVKIGTDLCRNGYEDHNTIMYQLQNASIGSVKP